jgi:nucleoside-diphosphate-sugar epimerase
MTLIDSSPVVVLTGISSFTGAWFAHELVSRGARIVGVLTRPLHAYEELQAQRLAWLAERVTLIEEAPIGSLELEEALSKLARIDAIGWHHAVVGDYRSPDFPVGHAIDSSLTGVARLAAIAADRGCRAAVITHSVFESGQGLPPDGGAIGLYGVAKRAVSEGLTLRMDAVGIVCSHFTICNPVGPLESARLTGYLVRQWLAGGIPVLKAPHWVRDNIPSDLLALAYADALEGALEGTSRSTVPSWRPMKNLEWAQLVSSEFGDRLGVATPLAVSDNLDDSEPILRTGVDTICAPAKWSEPAFWDSYANFYRAPQ